MITREQARAIAERFLHERGPMPGWGAIARVLSPDEVEASARAVTAVSSGDSRWRNCWLVSVQGEARGVISISADDGTIAFAGSVMGG